MKIFTIGFTKRSAREFFTSLSLAEVKRLIDVRLNNVSQLAGFSKRDDLKFFLDVICGIPYVHVPELAPTQDLLDDYKKVSKNWAEYETRFNALIDERHIEHIVSREMLESACLLCSEHTPEYCHRRLVAEYLREKWGDVEISHL
jgi:uncharacterized protein (DUF488 family)